MELLSANPHPRLYTIIYRLTHARIRAPTQVGAEDKAPGNELHNLGLNSAQPCDFDESSGSICFQPKIKMMLHSEDLLLTNSWEFQR